MKTKENDTTLLQFPHNSHVYLPTMNNTDLELTSKYRLKPEIDNDDALAPWGELRVDKVPLVDQSEPDNAVLSLSPAKQARSPEVVRSWRPMSTSSE